MYRTLDSGRILATIGRLRARIRERFPDAGLNGVCAEVEQVARETEQHCAWIERPHLPLRVGGFLAVLVLALPAALYAQHLNDAVVLSAVTELEGLTNDLSRKIWLKIDSADFELAE